MGYLAKVALGRSELPSRCLVFGGVYSPRRAKLARRHFDAWKRVRGNWITYSYAKLDGREYLVCFNVYGAATTLELLHLLKDGKAKSVFFVGSMGSKNLEVGTLVLPDEVVDRAGIVLLDSPHGGSVKVESGSLREVEKALRNLGIDFVMGKTASVPSVLHEVGAVRSFLSRSKSILGVELELSTLHYFGRRLGLKTYGLLYVSDNPKHGIVTGPASVWRARMNALNRATEVALSVL